MEFLPGRHMEAGHIDFFMESDIIFLLLFKYITKLLLG